MSKDTNEKEITTTEETVPEKKKKSLKPLIITLSVVAVLLIVAGSVLGTLWATGVLEKPQSMQKSMLYDLLNDHSDKKNSINWGMTPPEVKEHMTVPLSKDSPYDLVYKTETVMGVTKPTHMFFSFSNKNLWQIKMGWDISGKDDNFVTKLLTTFEEKYGEAYDYSETKIPLQYEYVWKDENTYVIIEVQSTYVSVYFRDSSYAVK